MDCSGAAATGTELTLLSEYEKWAKLTNHLLTLLSHEVDEDKHIQLKFALGRSRSFTLFCPEEYPNHEENTFFVEATPCLQLWCNTINEFILDSDSLLTLETILYKAAALYYKSHHKSPCTSTSDSDVEAEEEMVIAEDSDEELDYMITQKKKLWRQKEAQLRAVTNQPKTSDMFEGSIKDHPKQVFSNSGASGILTNDLVEIMRTSKHTGINAEAVDDNIYRWHVYISSFDPMGELHVELTEIQKRHGYSFIQLQLDFTMDLYPFYPPVIKVVRPRLKGSMMIRVAGLVKLSSWNPARDMKSVLIEIKTYLENWARIDLKSVRNDRCMYPNGSYGDIENHLLWLACVSEIPPRAGLKYPDITREESISIAIDEKKKQSDFSLFPAGTGFSSEYVHTGWDVKAYLAAQKEKDKQVDNVLQKILQDLRTGRTGRSSEKPSEISEKPSEISEKPSEISEKPSEISEKPSEISKKSSRRPKALKTAKMYSSFISLYTCPVDMMDESVLTSEADNCNHEVENKSEKMIINYEPVASTSSDYHPEQNESHPVDLDDLFDVLESSSLVPFLEKKLFVDSFFEVCQHTSVYQRVVDIIKEISSYPELVPLLWNLPGQQNSLYSLVHRLDEQAVTILAKVGQTSSNGNIPKCANTVESVMDGSQFFGFIAEEEKLTHTTEDEKLARDFHEITEIMDAALKEAGLLGSEADAEGDVFLPACCESSEPLAQTYREALKDLQFRSCDIEVEGASAHHYGSDFKLALPPNCAQVMRIAQEVAALSTALPLNLESSIFIRTDDAKCTLLRALIIGPEGTPYSGGCFQFDIFFPPRYPSTPPLVHFCTTGMGHVRFNPNLYANGMVCLSLLGTWKGLQGEQWNPTSTILQVLVSIQSLILVPEPFFNEPGYETLLGTEEGKQTSKAYNKEILMHTINHAMLGQIRRPSSGFEDVIKTHFRIKKDRILQELKSLIDESCVDLVKAYKALEEELENLVNSPPPSSNPSS